MIIKNITSRIISDSRGEKTIKVFLETEKGKFSASVPSGLSKSRFEAKTVSPDKAVENIKKLILPVCCGKAFSNQSEFDKFLIELDATREKSRLGANTILALSSAFARAGAADASLKLYEYISFLLHNDLSESFFLPRPCFNILEGGSHARNNSLDIQEFMVVPGQHSFSDNLKIGKTAFKKLKIVVERKFGALKIADEGGIAPPIKSTNEAFILLTEALSSLNNSFNVEFGIDAASSEFFTGQDYLFEGEKRSGEEMIEFYENLLKNKPLVFLEDPFSQDDFLSWQRAMHRIGNKVLLVGDDLLATNPERIKMAGRKNLCSAMILKPNQIGTISESIKAARLAKKLGWKIIVSHRSGETKDDFIADLAVGVGADFIKSGAPGPEERMAKYRRLSEIERQIER